MNKVKILLAEDQHLIRQAMQQLLQSNQNYEIVAALGNGEEVLQYLKTATMRPDLCILDIHMPLLDGIDTAVLLKEYYPHIKIVLLTSFTNKAYLEKGMLASVHGYILKESDYEQLNRTIEMVLEGQFVAPWGLMDEIMTRYKQLNENERMNKFDEKVKALPYMDSFDKKDLEIIRCIWLGWTNRMIAESLYISEGTLKNNLTRIYRRLKINNRNDLIKLLGPQN